MTKEQKDLLNIVFDKINHIYNWDNKNLHKRQEQELFDCLDILETLLKGEEVVL